MKAKLHISPQTCISHMGLVGMVIWLQISVMIPWSWRCLRLQGWRWLWSLFSNKVQGSKLCNGRGTKVILTDSSSSNETNFVLSSKAFLEMARKGMGNAILKHGMVDIEYKRVPCEYNKNNTSSVRVEEMSQKPNYLVLEFLYQGGQTDIFLVDIIQDGHSNCIFIRREHGVVWEIVAAPTRPLLFKLHVIGGFDAATITTEKPIPADWKVGERYDLGVQLDEILIWMLAILVPIMRKNGINW